MTLNSVKDTYSHIKLEKDIPDDFNLLGNIDTVYPTLTEEILSDFYRCWIWENNQGERIATWDQGNSHCYVMCEGTSEAIIQEYKKVINENN